MNRLQMGFEDVIRCAAIAAFMPQAVVVGLQNLWKTLQPVALGVLGHTLEEWSLELKASRATLDFRFGYLIGLQDPDTIQAINWRYRLVTKDELELARFEEEMRAASPEKTQLFVQGDRSRKLEIDTPLEPGAVYVLWFELDYKGERLHEILFPVIAGESGGDPDWAEIYEESI